MVNIRYMCIQQHPANSVSVFEGHVWRMECFVDHGYFCDMELYVLSAMGLADLHSKGEARGVIT